MAGCSFDSRRNNSAVLLAGIFSADSTADLIFSMRSSVIYESRFYLLAGVSPMREGSLKREPRRIEMGERLFQLSQFRRRTMHLYAGKIGHGEHFREQRAHIFQMRENAFGISVAFAA